MDPLIAQMEYQNYTFRIMMGHKHLNPKAIPLAHDPIVLNLLAKLHATKLINLLLHYMSSSKQSMVRLV